MKDLSPEEAARIAFSVIQKVRQEFKESKQFTLSNAATLLAVLAGMGEKQGDMVSIVGGINSSAVAKHLDLLEGRGAGPGAPRLLYRTQNDVNRKENDIVVTEEGRRFAASLAKHLSRQLTSLHR